jgi:2-methylisocitrate lyase-like PEP mutase family enzyme
MTSDDTRARFRTLHEQGTFTMPNPHDVGSARLLESLGFPAIATTSGGFAMSLGRPDMTVRRDELVAHVAELTAATDLPLNVDAEQCFPDDEGGIDRTVALLAEAGASGCSIEDWDPVRGRITERAEATERVRIAAAAAHRTGVVLTARAENHLHGIDDLDDTIGRLCAYRDAGAAVLYAPLLVDLDQIERVVTETGAPINVLLVPGGPSVAQLAERGVRRLSIGSLFALAAYGALYDAAVRLRDDGVISTSEPFLGSEGRAAFRTPA